VAVAASRLVVRGSQPFLHARQPAEHRLAEEKPCHFVFRQPRQRLAGFTRPAYEIDIGIHVFPTQKYRLILDKLLEERTIDRTDLLTPEPAADDDVALAHTPSFVDKINNADLTVQEEMVLEVPFSRQLRDAMWLCAGGTILTGRVALEQRVAMHLGGGFHHAFGDHGEGFCLINDIAVAIRSLIRRQEIRRAAIIDLDVHHGNGTAAIFAEDADVFTLSIHQQNNYPAWKPPSDLDVGLADGTSDAAYLDALEGALPRVLTHEPDIVFYLAGADPYRHDQLGGLSLTLEGLRHRDDFVLETLAGRGIPVAVTLAGGYAANHGDTVEIHCGTVRAAAAIAGSAHSIHGRRAK
jgi:acetoin utilization deacetylase AcuC-like enzyme